MSIDSRIRSYESVFQDWKVKEYLGGGSGGQTGRKRAGSIDDGCTTRN